MGSVERLAFFMSVVTQLFIPVAKSCTAELESLIGYLDRYPNGAAMSGHAKIIGGDILTRWIEDKWSMPAMKFGNTADLLNFTRGSAIYIHEVVPVARRAGQKSVTIIWPEYVVPQGRITELPAEIDNLQGPVRHSNIVFIGQESFILNLFSFEEIRRLKRKSGLIVENCQVVIDPPVYIGGFLILPKVPLNLHASKVDFVRNRLIRISGSKMPPYCDVRIENGKEVFSGSNFDVIHSASVKLNFSYTLDAPPRKSPGARLPNGTWVGMLADVLAGKADMTIVNAYNVERYRVIDFTRFFTVTTLTFVTSHPKKTVSLGAIIYPYDNFVWLMIVFSFCVVWMTFLVTYLWNPYHPARNFAEALSSSFFVPLSMSLRQDLPIPRGFRLISMWWAAFVLLIGVGYESNLVSYLTFPEIEPVPTNFGELANEANYKLYFNIFSNIGRSLFHKGTSDMLRKLDTRYLSEVNPVNCVVPTFKDKESACVGWNDILNSAMGKNLTLRIGIEPLFMSQHSLLNNWLAFGLKKDSPYTESFSFIAASYAETGLVQRWKDNVVNNYRKSGKKWMMTQKETELYRELNDLASHADTEPKPFAIANVKISFLLFFVGILISSIGFGMEIIANIRNLLERVIGGGTPKVGYEVITIPLQRLAGRIKKRVVNQRDFSGRGMPVSGTRITNPTDTEIVRILKLLFNIK